MNDRDNKNSKEVEYLMQVEEKVQMTKWSLQFLSEIDDQINQHLSQA